MSASSHMLQSSFCTASPPLCARENLRTENMKQNGTDEPESQYNSETQQICWTREFDSLCYWTLVFDGHEMSLHQGYWH